MVEWDTASAGVRAYMRVWGRVPSGSPGAKPPMRESGTKPPLKLKALEHLSVKGKHKFANFSVFCKFSSIDECWLLWSRLLQEYYGSIG